MTELVFSFRIKKFVQLSVVFVKLYRFSHIYKIIMFNEYQYKYSTA